MRTNTLHTPCKQGAVLSRYFKTIELAAPGFINTPSCPPSQPKPQKPVAPLRAAKSPLAVRAVRVQEGVPHKYVHHQSPRWLRLHGYQHSTTYPGVPNKSRPDTSGRVRRTNKSRSHSGRRCPVAPLLRGWPTPLRVLSGRCKRSRGSHRAQ